jgi:octanoyl-[GcvH]:protein N-octanoyltransferase
MQAFGCSFQIIDDTELPADARPSPQNYAAWVKEQLTGLRLGDQAILRFRRPRPTAAFSPQDTTHPDYEEIKKRARARGFEPIERGTGGRLTLFDENALGITIIAPHAAPHSAMIRRYEILSSAIASGLQNVGIDAHVGELPNEYCPGKYSVNAEGRIKLVGVAQRMNQRCLQMGAIVSVHRSEEACAGIAEAYCSMGLNFDPLTYGAMADFVPSLTYADVRSALRETISAALMQASHS